ncbi:hypothetical protein FMUND_5722 [Fusarium mundagurra]|uniref:Uncharacterized protein n=1 Tax=Fusarium mundagurra TaxID=1567541 RepID=A0A8H5YUE9_9HYPO|nr:hypothetical protein FMUND_5722 [Fusarium mundagurra]
MVKLALITLGVFAFSAIAGSVTDRKIDTDATAPFSLESWVSGIIADPDGAHLRPDEAYALAVNQTKNDSGTLEKRTLSCNSLGRRTSAGVFDVLLCIASLASRGRQGCSLGLGGRAASFCRHGSAIITGHRSGPLWGGGIPSCGDVARAATQIVRKCTRDGRVQGWNDAYRNGRVTVNIRGL